MFYIGNNEPIALMTFIEAIKKAAKKNFMPMQSAICQDTASLNSHSINPHLLSVRNPDTSNNKHNPSEH
ncbi:hypothetical protein [Paraglaciecola sp. MB-3u-78]|uniref:hypothetical protein n=1 Tax=Paraglaciecola sp. MB-3u-78 TaxID=2058332 RepID=UPI001E519BDF|nr:hypothetical protein [Paraglaciecola sp. MB-3u-78]